MTVSHPSNFKDKHKAGFTTITSPTSDAKEVRNFDIFILFTW